MAAGSGVGLSDLIARMGHDSERAAIIYQAGRTWPDGPSTGTAQAIPATFGDCACTWSPP
jgi:hypothetical protein